MTRAGEQDAMAEDSKTGVDDFQGFLEGKGWSNAAVGLESHLAF